MKFFLISDNIDTLTGLRLVGIEGKVVHTRHDFLTLLENKMRDPEIAIILVTTKLIELCPDIIIFFSCIAHLFFNVLLWVLDYK